MCMDTQSSKMGDDGFEDDVEILRCRIDKGMFEEVPVKEEHPDEAEIAEMAAKLVEANKAKMQTPSVPLRPTGGGQLGNQGCLNRKPGETVPAKSPDTGKAPLDDESQRGRFGWITFDKVHIPYIFRGSEKYCAVRILEAKLLNKYLNYLHSDIYSCTCIKSYYITEVEAKLLNDINVKHCEGQFGKEQFTCKDLVVRLADAEEFYSFLDVCYTKLTSQNVGTCHKGDKCGFIRINKESVVPYTVKDNLKFVPLFYFEGETDNLKLKAEKLEGWDLSYLKFCCKVQGIRNELFASETCSVISLSDIKSYFPPGTGFEDYWPSKVMDSQLFVSGKTSASAGGWTKQPPAPPSVAKSPALGTKQINSRQNIAAMNVRPPANAAAMPARQVTSMPAHVTQTVPSRPQNASQAMLNPMPTTVNGWNGLVGGQPTFQAAIISQANPVVRMQNPSLNMHNMTAKTYSVAARNRGGTVAAPAHYGVYPVTTMQQNIPQQPPPLVRATVHSTQQNLGVGATYTSPSLTVPNAVSANTYPQMLNLSHEQVQALLHPQTASPALMSHSQRLTPPAHNAHNPKHAYPPPLIPVNGSNNARDARGRKALIPIAEAGPSNCPVAPYNVQKALVEEKLVPCINFKPYVYAELLMTVPDFIQQYFPNSDINNCRQVLTDVLCIDLYQGNRQQMKILLEAGKCSSMTEELPLIQVRDIMRYMPQMKYMFRNMGTNLSSPPSEEHPAKKRQRTS